MPTHPLKRLRILGNRSRIAFFISRHGLVILVILLHEKPKRYKLSLSKMCYYRVFKICSCYIASKSHPRRSQCLQILSLKFVFNNNYRYCRRGCRKGLLSLFKCTHKLCKDSTEHQRREVGHF